MILYRFQSFQLARTRVDVEGATDWKAPTRRVRDNLLDIVPLVMVLQTQ